MFADRMWTSWEQAGLIMLTALLMVIAVVTTIRVVGLRAFSKMSSFDFAITVAIGSIVATTVASSTPFANGALAVFALLGVQFVIAWMRRHASFGSVVDNTPLLLMRDGEIIDAALSASRVTEADVIAKLREANALDLSGVHAVVLETTGDISVLHGGSALDDMLLEGVRDLRV